MNREAASDYPRAGNLARRGVPTLIEVSGELAARRLSPLGSFLVVTMLSLAIWAGIWAALSSLLWR